MRYTGRVRNGVVLLDDGTPLPEGARVEVFTVSEEGPVSLPAFGLWRDRSDMTDSAEASLSLRRATERRDDNG